jgi:hypothetical protein
VIEVRLLVLSSLALASVAGPPASADGLYKLVYGGCEAGRLRLAFSNSPSGIPDPPEPRPALLRTPHEFAEEGPIACEFGDVRLTADVVAYAGWPGGECAEDNAVVRLTVEGGGESKLVDIRRSHGWACIHSVALDRQIFVAPEGITVCSKPADGLRRADDLDLTGYDCIDYGDFVGPGE